MKTDLKKPVGSIGSMQVSHGVIPWVEIFLLSHSPDVRPTAHCFRLHMSLDFTSRPLVLSMAPLALFSFLRCRTRCCIHVFLVPFAVPFVVPFTVTSANNARGVKYKLWLLSSTNSLRSIRFPYINRTATSWRRYETRKRGNRNSISG